MCCQPFLGDAKRNLADIVTRSARVAAFIFASCWLGVPSRDLADAELAADTSQRGDHHASLTLCAASVAADVRVAPKLWMLVASQDSRGIENENVAPGPSLGAAHKRP